jgi:PAS domain S-box-containing protein
VSDRRAQPALDPRPAPILLVDDHPPNLMALEAILEPLGEKLVRASSGAEAVEAAGRTDFALVLLDLQMPELDGLETAALLKKADRSRAAPIIIVTADEPTRSVLERGYATGAVDFLSKPLDPDVLRSKVSVFVELYKQRFAPPRASEPRPRTDPTSNRVSERLLAAAPAEGEAIATVEAILRIHDALSEDLDLPRMAARLVEEVTAVSSARGGAFHYLTRGAARVALAGELRAELLALGPDSLLVEKVFQGQRTIRLGDEGAHGARPPGEARSVLAVPVLSRAGHVSGALVLASDRPEAFGDRDEELAVVAAHHAGAALENARLYEEAKEARHRAELAQLELRAGEARLRLALDSAGLGTWEHNPMTGSLRWDARARALFGLSPDAPVDYAVFLAGVHADDRARVDDAVKRALDPAGPGAFDEEYRAVGLEDGVERWIAAKGQSIVEQGRTLRFLGTVLDVTAKKRIEQERALLLSREREARGEAESARARAEFASRAKDEFLATVSHELRNPLNAILGWSRVLLEEGEDFDAARQRKGLEVIARNARAQVQLVEDILEVSRIVTGKLRLKTAPMEVRGTVEAAVEALRAAAQAKGVLLETRFEEPLGAIVADEDRIQQILWNLLSNAVKFTPPGGRVSVGVQHGPSDVVLVVSDSGEGIEASFLPYVFDRFRQADASTTRTHGGLGLGLAIVRHLAELHGGTVRAESGGKGRGATFIVRLPIQPVKAAFGDEPITRTGAHRARVLTASPVSPLAGRRVVVLDDEEDMRDLLAMILEHAGASVQRAATVDEALRAIEKARPDVVLSDLAMPEQDGYMFVRRLRADRGLSRLPVVAMTAYARAEDRHRVLAAGFQRHVAKPIEPAELVAAILEVANGAPSDDSGPPG